MSIQVQRRRGTATQHETFVGAPGELTVDTTNNRVVVHDGVTLGGTPMARFDDVTDQNAIDVPFDPSNTSLTAVNVQEAIEEVDQALSGISIPGVISDLTDVDTSGATSGDILKFNGTTWVSELPDNSSVSRGYIFGLAASNNTSDASNDIDIAPGEATSDSTNPVLIKLTSTITKRTDAAWAAGSGNGGWLDGSSMPDGTGHVFLIYNPSTEAVDVGLSASLSPTLPSGYTHKRLIWSVLRVSGVIRPFLQLGHFCVWMNPVLDFNAVAPGGAPVLRVVSVPDGLKCPVTLDFSVYNEPGVANCKTWVSDPDTTDREPDDGLVYGYGVPNNNSVNINIQIECSTNSARQIRTHSPAASFGASGTSITAITRRFEHPRGRYV
jgi:hypothetical protein